MSFNIQALSACVLSLLAGFYLGRCVVPSPGGTQQKRKKSEKSSPGHSATTNCSENSSPEPPAPLAFLDHSTEDSEEYPSESEEEEFQVNSTSLNSIPGETKMALVVRTDLGMTKGKAAAQCAHAALGCYRLMQAPNTESQNLDLLRRWERTGQAKITLQVKSKEDLDLLFAHAISLDVNCYIVHDAGRTQIEAGSATVLGLGPAPKIVLDQITGKLKLY